MTLNAQTEQFLRQAFKYGNRGMLLLWRLGLGPSVNASPTYGGRVMVLTHIGRKSRQLRRTPLNYVEHNGFIYCTAGFGSISDWYKNILADPHVEVWLPNGWWEGLAEDISDDPERLPLMREVLIASGVVAPMVGVDPRRLSDSALAEATTSYRLVRIKRTAARTGRGGPGELAWVWQLATLLLVLALLLRPRRRGSQKL